MINKLIMVFVCLLVTQSYAQEGTASPYSFYGIGSLNFKGTVENRSMGGISVYNDSIHLNLRNPAAYGGKNLSVYNNESRPIIYSVGGSHSDIKLTSNSGSDKTSTTTFDYLSFAIPLGKLGVGFGLLPYSSVGYKLENSNSLGNLTQRYRGQGGVNKTYLSFGYQITNELSFGATADYNFGTIENSTVEFLYNTNDELLGYQTREDNRSDLGGLGFNFGAYYTKKISEKLELQTSLTYSPETKLRSRNTRSFSTITLDGLGNENEINTVESDLASVGLETTNLIIPSKFNIGAGIGEPRKWFAGVDFTTQNTSNFSNRLYNYQNVSFENANTLSLGGFYIPKFNAFSGYFKRVVYRGGLRFEKTGLKVNNESIREFGISFGLGLPVGSGKDFFSNANIGFELGKRGTTNQNLIRENFVNLKFSLSLNDRWFQKRKYN
ncbi:hypothetical protein [Aurantibacter sp.]|uniref:hypothetical protein n=1 Tax=Aurantibacter sp. TaxID=2807103 RepID=UPI0035C82ADD